MTLVCRNNETPALQATQLNVKMTNMLSAVGICVGLFSIEGYLYNKLSYVRILIGSHL